MIKNTTGNKEQSDWSQLVGSTKLIGFHLDPLSKWQTFSTNFLWHYLQWFYRWRSFNVCRWKFTTIFRSTCGYIRRLFRNYLSSWTSETGVKNISPNFEAPASRIFKSVFQNLFDLATKEWIFRINIKFHVKVNDAATESILATDID